MRLSTSFLLLMCIGSLTAWGQPLAWSQERARDPSYSIKVYRVADLVFPTPNYAFEGVKIPGLDTGTRTRGYSGMHYGMGGMGMGGMGGMGGGIGGGGFFSVQNQAGLGGGGLVEPATIPHSRVNSFRFTLDDLVEAITSTVGPDSWDEVGGEGNITVLGGMLLIRQTANVHEQIGQLLRALRVDGGSIRSVTIRAHWLLLDVDQFKLLVRKEDRTGQQVVRQALKVLTDTTGARGQITCLDGQTVHLVTGQIKSSLTSVIPVVGQAEPAKPEALLAQRDAEDHAGIAASGAPQTESTPVPARHYLGQFTGGGVGDVESGTSGGTGIGASLRSAHVGYQPVTKTINFGALLQVTPTLIPHSQFVVLDLLSTVTLPTDDRNETLDYRGVYSLDRLNLLSQQFMTTLRMPLGQPVLVGGATLQPLSSEKAQLYLVVEATLSVGE